MDLTQLDEIVGKQAILFVIVFVLPIIVVGIGFIIWRWRGYSIYPIDISSYGRNVQILSDPIASIEQTVPPLDHRVEKNPIRILTGEASCASMCNKEIVNWIERAHRMENKIRIIAGPHIDSKTTPLLNKWITEDIIEFHYSKKRASRHFRIFGDHIYLEMPHRPNAKRRTGLNISGANSELRSKLAKEFDDLWDYETISVQTANEMETLIKRNMH
jgi:hypothetical protein